MDLFVKYFFQTGIVYVAQLLLGCDWMQIGVYQASHVLYTHPIAHHKAYDITEGRI